MAYKIISLFLIILIGLGFYLGMDMVTVFNHSLIKFAMNGILVLSLIPMLNVGMGMNFGLPVGITAGLIGMCVSINFSMTGLMGIGLSLLVGLIVAFIFALPYSEILIAVKGKEEIASTFIGFSFIPLMNFFWSLAPFQNRDMLYPIGGKGLRPRIGLNPYFTKALDSLFQIEIAEIILPIGLITLYFIVALMIWGLFKSNLGKRILAVGENELFSYASGIEVKQVKRIAVCMSLMISALGIIVYAQSFGFLELYDAPLMMAFPAVSALLIGGATAKKASITQALIGTYLFQSIYLLSVPIANELFLPEVSEIIRNIISNGIILYALMMSRKEALHD